MVSIAVLDGIAIALWLAALLIIAARWRRGISPTVNIVLTGLVISSMLYCVCMFVGWSGITSALERVEDLIGATLPMWWAFAVYAIIQSRIRSRLSESEAKYRRLVESLEHDYIIYSRNPAGVITYVSPSIVNVLGYRQEEWIGRHYAEDLTDHALNEDAIECAEAGMRGERRAAHECEYRDKQGNARQLEIVEYPILDAQGEVVAVEGIAHDITERRRAQEELQASEERFRTVVERAADALFLHDDQGHVVDVNQRACESVGYSREELLSMSMTDLEIADRADRDLEEIWKDVCSGKLATFEAAHRRKDGTTFPVEVSLGSLKLGDRLLLLAVARDVTERKQAEQELRLTQYAVDHAVEAAFWFRPEDGRIAYVNQAACWSLGYKREELLGLSLSDIDPDWSKETLPQRITRFKKAGNALFESRYRRKDGSVFPVEVTASFFSFEGQEYVVAFATDITERNRVKAEREQMISQLEAQNAELERFTYTVSHDLRSPLITLKGYLGLLAEDLADGDTPAVGNDVERLNSAADTMAEMLDELLELSRIGRVESPTEEIPLADLVRDAVDLVRGQIDERDVQIEIASDLPTVYGDRVRLLEVLQNLIDNAVKYMGDQPHPRIEIDATSTESATICNVRDNGIGLESRYGERVFQLFEQLDAQAEGTGIGLALAKRIVEVHGGCIWYESDGPGQGTTFSFSLPKASSHVASSTEGREP